MRMPSPWAITLLIVAGVIGYLQFLSYQNAHPLVEDAPAPSFTLPLLAQPREHVTPLQYHGRVLIIEAWARSCVTCRSSMPALEALAAAYHDRGLRVLHVALEDLADSVGVREFLAELGGRDVVVAMDEDGEFARNYLITGIPTSFVVDKKGRLRWQGLSTSYNVAHVLSRPAGRQLLDELVAE